MQKIDELRALFPALGTLTWLNTASYAIGSKPVRDAYTRALDAWIDGTLTFAHADTAAEEARARFARLVRAEPETIAMVPSLSTAAGVVAAQLPQAARGENILVGDIEFTSNYYPWLLLRDRGWDVRRVKAIDGALPPDAFAAAADSGTRLIAVSAVQASSGYRADLPALASLARRSGAWLFVDGAQAVGAIDIDVKRDDLDFLGAPSHKFLLGTRGIGYLYVRQELLGRMRPLLAGWRAAKVPAESFFGPDMDLSVTASKLDTPLGWFGAIAEPEGLGILERFGRENVFERNRRLADRLHEQLCEHRLIHRTDVSRARSHIVSVPIADADAVTARLRESRVVVAKRSGRIRLSVHFYNTESEIDRVIALLAAVERRA